MEFLQHMFYFCLKICLKLHAFLMKMRFVLFQPTKRNPMLYRP